MQFVLGSLPLVCLAHRFCGDAGFVIGLVVVVVVVGVGVGVVVVVVVFKTEQAYFTTVKLIYTVGYGTSLASLSIAVLILLLFRYTGPGYRTMIPQGRLGYGVIAHEDERDNCFSKKLLIATYIMTYILY